VTQISFNVCSMVTHIPLHGDTYSILWWHIYILWWCRLISLVTKIPFYDDPDSNLSWHRFSIMSL